MTAVFATISDAFSSYRNQGAANGGRRRGRRAIGLMLIAQLVLLTGIVPQGQAQDGIADPAGANSIAADVGTTIVLTLAPSSINQSQSTTLTATVTSDKSGTPVVTGTVDFCRAGAPACAGSDRIGTAQLFNGAASIVIFADPGQHSYTAMFRGGPGYTASASTSQTLTVSRTSLYPTTAAIGTVNSAPPYTIPVTVTGLGVLPGLAPNGVADILDTSNNDYPLAITPSMGNTAYGIATASAILVVGRAPYSTASEDFNKDGRADLAVANQGYYSNVQIFLAQSDGTFPATPSSTIPNIDNAYPVVAGDFNNDGYVDLAVGATSNISVFTGKEKGGFDPSPINTAASDLVAFAVRDFDLDGTLDIAVVTTSNSQVYLGDGKGRFPTKGTSVSVGSNPQATDTGGSTVGSAAVGDFNNDGKPDLIVPQTPTDKVWVLLGDGLGSFQPDPTQVSTGTDANAMSVAVADFDGDGNLDFAVGVNNPNGPGYVTPYQGDPTGKIFTKKTPYSIGDANWESITLAVGDFNADGKPDIATAYFAAPPYAYMQLLLGGAAWTFTQGATIPPGIGPVVPVTGDFNGDGFTDVAVADSYEGFITVAIVQPSVTVTATATDVLVPVGDPSAADHQVVAVYEGDMKFARSPQSAPVGLKPQKLDTTLALSAVPGSPVAAPRKVVLSASLDAGKQDLQGYAPSGLVTFSIQNGKQLGTAPFAWDDTTKQYVAALPAQTLPVGSYTIQATYPGDGNFNASTPATMPFTVTGTITTLKITPDTVDQGKPATLIATVTDDKTAIITSGTVDFCRSGVEACAGSDRIGSAQIANGEARIVIFADVGLHSYTARFRGITGYPGSRSTSQTLTVTPTSLYTTTTVIGKVEGTGPYNLPVTVTGFGTLPAQVRPDTPAGLAPTGDVTILDKTNNNFKLGSVTLTLPPVYGVAETTATLTTGNGPFSLAGADFNDDGLLDLAVANATDNNIQIFLAQSDGKFPATPSWTISNVTGAYSIVAADFTNDGYIDLAVGATSNISVFTGKGKDGFNPTPFDTAASDIVAFAVSDFDASGTLDLALVTSGSSQIWLGDGKGKFTAKGSPVPPGSTMKWAGANAAAGDFNNDAKPDLLVPQGPGSKVWVLLGDGTGLFQTNPTQIDTRAGATVQAVAVADFDQDGNLDFTVGVATSSSDTSVAFYQGQGDGKTFIAKPAVTFAGTANVNVTVGDFNADGWPDAAAAIYFHNDNDTIQILLGSSSQPWTFTPSTIVQVGVLPLSPVVGDFNGDGFADVAVANAIDNSVSVATLQPTVAVTATVNNVPVPVGNPADKHDVFASYAGDKQFKASDSSANPTPIAPQQIVTDLKLAADPAGRSLIGQKVKLTATLTFKGDLQGHSVENEKVTFTADTTPLGTAELHLVDGSNPVAYTAKLGPTALPAGKITIKADYGGDQNFAASSDTLPYDADSTDPEVDLAVSTGETANAGDTVTLTATVKSGGTMAQLGTVDFCYTASTPLCTDINRIGSAQVVNGTATVSFTPYAGTYELRADFAGTPGSLWYNYPQGRSQPRKLVVLGGYPTQTAITPPKRSGNNDTYDVKVTGTAPQSLKTPPTGTVQIQDMSNLVGGNPYSLGENTGSNPLANPQLAIANMPTTLIGGGGANSAATADFDGNGIRDVVIALKDDKKLIVIMNGGPMYSRTFTDGNPYPVATGDFNNDALPDIVIGNGDKLTVYPGTGSPTGQFGAPIDTPDVSDFAAIVARDFDLDGHLDLFIEHSDRTQFYWGGYGTGEFIGSDGSWPYGNSGSATAVSADTGDFDNDGWPDLIVPNNNGSVWVVYITFGPNTKIDTGGDYTWTVAAADFDKDGNLDFAVGFGNYEGESAVQVYQGNGDRSFSPQPKFNTNYALGGTNVSVIAGDFNADGYADLAMADYVASGSNPDVQIWTGDGNFGFTKADVPITPQPGPRAPVTGDFNGDGYADLIVPGSTANQTTAAFLSPTVTVSTSVDALVPMGDPGGAKHNIVGAYLSDSNFAADTSTTPQAVQPEKLDLGITLAANPSQVPVNQSTTLTATLTTQADLQDHSLAGQEVTFHNTTLNKDLGKGTISWISSTQYIATYVTKPGDLSPKVGDKDVLSATLASNPYFATPTPGTTTVTITATP